MTPQIDRLRKTSPVLRVSTHIYGVSKERDGKTFIFQVTLDMWPLKLIVSEKQGLFWEFQHIYGVSKERDGKTFIFQVTLDMWPSNWSSQKNKPCSESFNTHLWGFSGNRWENIHFSVNPRHVIPQIDFNTYLWDLRKTSPVLRGFNTHLWGFSGDRWS